MTVVFSATNYREYDDFNADRAQAWLRGEGIVEALVYQGAKHDQVCVEVPMGTSNTLIAEAVKKGYSGGRPLG